MSVVVSNEKRVRIALEEDEYEIGKKEAPEAAGKENGPSEQPAEKPPKKPDKPEKHQPVQSPSSPDEQHAMLTDGNASFLRAARGGNLDKVLEYLQGSTDINTSNANGLNALHLSSKEGHLNIVTELLKRGADVDAATKKGNTALHIASLAGQEDIVSVLVQFNANVNVQSQNGFTPLYMAAQENHVKVVKFLLANGANQNLATEDGFLPLDVATQQGHDVVVETLLQHSRPQYPNKSEDGFTPLAVALQQGHDKVVAVLLENDRAGKTRLPALHIAARKDDTKAASLLLQNGHNPDVPSKSGFTPLHIAAHYGHVNVATILLQKGASVDYAARNHITPLHVAAKWGRVNMVNTLLDRGARIDAKTRDGLTPLHCSARSGHEQCVDQLLERGAPISAKTKNGLAPLHMAAQGDHLDSARLLLYHHAPVDDVTVDYLTPLHVAAHCGHHKVAKLLLDRKANPSARALNGFTPLHIACKKNRVKVIELLLKYGASVQATTESGLTPLHVAAFMGNINIVMYLIKNGGGVDETNVRGETPLHLAARANQIEVIRVLLSNGAKVDARAHENQTPLHIAARLGNAEIVKLLLDNGASPDAQTRDLYTALHIAAREGKEDVAKVLLDNGASLSMTTKKEFTPLHVAAKYGRYDVAQLLLSRYASPDATAQNGLTPLHIAAHYDNVKVAMLLLDQGATPHKTAKNGFTPLHIAAKKNQMDVATTLLEYGADANAMTKQGISPIHLAAQEGHTEMLALLLERGAKPNITAKNGLTPLHLAAQEDQVEAVAMLLDNGAQIDPSTRAGYTPLHVACHYGNLKTATYLLEHGSAVQAKTKHGLTPLHQGAQQGHVAIINILLQHKADPNETANNGYTALGIAKRFGYISVVNTLTIVTTETSTVISPTEEKLKVQVPETMQVTFMSDTEDEGDDVSMTGDQSLLTPQEIRNMGDDSVANDNRRSWEEDWMRGEPVMSYYTGADSLSGHYNAKLRPAYSPTGYSTMDSRNSTLNRDYSAPLGRPDESLIEGEITVKTESMLESAPPLLSSTPARPVSGEAVVTINGKAYNMGDPFVDENGRLVPGKAFGPNGRPVSVTLDNAPLNSMPFFAGFLISFIVDARGGTMRSCRLPGLRVVVPPQRASGPTRVTCRLIKRTKLTTQPPLMENESLASRVLEVGPANTQFLGGLGNKSVTYPPLNDGESLCSRIIEMGPSAEKFLRPVLIEVPHFASLRGREREIVILRSENGETWKEHSLDASDEEIQKAMEGYDQEDNDQSKNATDRRLCRILTKDFPQYFAIISRVRQETNTIGPSGGMLSSTVVPQVQAVFPEGTLTKKIKVGLQAQHVGNDVVKKVLGNRVMVSPIVTIEPRRRKFHKPITVTIPVPTAYNQGNINGYGWDTPTLRLLCSITGGTAPAQWEDITGTTPLTFVNDCVSFTTTVSARFWLMDCKEIDQASNFARELYQELKAVPFMAKFVVYAKTHDPVEGRIRVFCVTDDRSDKSLEQQENFKEVARSKFVEVLESRPVYVEMAGNLVPVQKSGDQLNLAFNAFHENRLPFFVRVRDQSAEKCGRLSFMREPKQPRGLPPQKAACNLNVTMPPYVKVKKASESESESEESSEDEEYRMEKGEREQYSTQKEQKLFTKKELYSLTSIEEYQVGSKEQDGVPSNLNFASIKLRKKYTFLQDPSMSPKSAHQRAEIRLWDVANQVGDQWQDLGRELGLSERELKAIEKENEDTPEQAFVMLHNWAEHEGKDASSEKLEDGLRSIGRGDIIDRCLGNYVSLDVSAQPEEEEESDLYRDIQMAMDSSRAEERLQNDLEDLAAKGEISLEFSGVQATPDLLPSAVEEQARKEVTDKLIQELKEEAIEASSSEDIKESAAAAEFYEDIKEEILEKHEEERRELHFEPSFGTLEETKEEESPSPTGPEKSNVDMASSGPSSSKSVTITQTRVTIASKTVDSSQPVESGSESSAETAVFSGTTDKTLEGAADQIRVQVDSISSEGEVKVDELEGVQLPPSVSQVSQVRIEVDEAPTPDRMSSDENLYIAHASNIVQEPEISAQAENEVEGINPHMDMEPEPIGDVVVEEPQIQAVPERQQESINPYCDMEPEPIGDVVIEEPQIQASAQQRQEGINPYAEMEPEPLTGAEPIQEPSVSAVSTSTVQGINPDLIGDSDVLDATCNIPGPDLTDIRHTSMGAQSWEGETSPGQQAYSQSPQEDLKVGHPGESTVQQITLESKIVVSKSEVERSEPLKSGYSVTTTEVTVSESGSPRVDEDEVPLATEQFAEEVQKTVRPATLDEPVHEHQEKGEVTWKETTSSETITRTVKSVEQTVTILQEKTDEPKLVPSEQHERVQESAEKRPEAHVEDKEPPAQVQSDHEEPEHQVDIRQKIKQFEAKIEEASMPSQPKEAVVKEDKKHVPAEATHAPDRPEQETQKFEKEKATVDDIPKSKSDDIPVSADTVVHSFVEEKTIITKGTEVQLQEAQGEKEEVDGGVFSKPVPPADVGEKEADIPGQQVREYVSTVVDTVIIQKQYGTEDGEKAVDKPEEFKEPQDVSIPDETLPEEVGGRERDALLPASQTEKEVVEHTVKVVKETHMFQKKEMAYPAEEPKDVEKDIPTDSQPEGPVEEKMAEETCKSQEIDVPREPMEDERDVLQSESKHEDIVVTTQTLAAMNAPDYEEDDISTSMEAMPSERDDFLEDIQEEQEMVPSDSSIEREEEKDFSQTPIEKSQPEEIHREGIIEQHIDGKVITTEYKETITKDVQKVEVDTGDVKEDSKPFSDPGHVIRETVHHTTVTSSHTEIHTTSVADIPEPGIDENLPKVSQVPEEKSPSEDTVSVSFEGPLAEPESHVHEDMFSDKQPADEAVERNGQQEPEPKVDGEIDGKSQAGEPAMTTKCEEVELETHREVHVISETHIEEKMQEKEKDVWEEQVGDRAIISTDGQAILRDEEHKLEEMQEEKEEVLVDREPSHKESEVVIEGTVQHTHVSASPIEAQSVSESPVEREQEKEKDICEERLGDRSVTAVDRETIMKEEVHQLEEIPVERQEEVPVDQKPLHEETKVVIEETIQHTQVSASPIEIQSASESPVEREQEKEKDICEERLGDKLGTAVDKETILKEEIHQLEEIPVEKQEEVPVDQKPLHEETKVVIEETIQHTHVSASSIKVQSVSESPVETVQEKEKDICEDRLGDNAVTPADRDTILKEEIHKLEEMPEEKKEEVLIDQEFPQDVSKIVIEESVKHTHITSTHVDVQSLSEVLAEEKEVEKDKDICEEPVVDGATTTSDKETIQLDGVHQLEEKPGEKQEVLADQAESTFILEESIQHTQISSSPEDDQSVSETPVEREQEKRTDVQEERPEDIAVATVDGEVILKDEFYQLEEMPKEKQNGALVEEERPKISSTHVDVQSLSETPEEKEAMTIDDIQEKPEGDGVTNTERQTIPQDEVHRVDEMLGEKQREALVDQEPPLEESKIVLEETIQHTQISASHIDIQTVSESSVEREQEKEKDIIEERLGDSSVTAVDRETVFTEEIHQLEEMPEEKQEEVPVDQKPLHEESKVVIEETVQHTHISASSVEVQSVSESPVEREQEKEKDICEERLGDKSGTADDRETILKEEIHQLEEMPEEKQEEVPVDQKPLHEESKVVIEETVQHTHISASSIEVQSVSESPVEREQEKEKDICEERLGDKSGTADDRETILKEEIHQLEEMPEEKQEEVPVDQKPLHEESKVVIEEAVQNTHISASSIEVQSVSESPVEREQEKEKDICEERLGDKSGTADDRETILKEEIHQLEEMPEEKQEEVPVDQKPLHEESKVVIEETVQHTHISASSIEVQSVSESPVEREQEKEKDICEERLGDKSGTADDRETILKEEIHQLEEMPEEKQEEVPVDQKPLHEESKVVIEETVQHTHISASSIEVQSVSESPVEREQEKEKDICEERLGDKSGTADDRETILKEEIHQLEEMPEEKQEEVPVDQKPLHEESKVVIEETVQHTHISASSIEVQSVSESPVEREQEKEKDICEERLGDKSGTADDRETILKEEIHQLEEMPKEKQEEVPVDQKPLHEESKVVIEETVQHTHISASSIEVQSVIESPVEREQEKEKDICEEHLGDKSGTADDRETILKEEIHQLEEMPKEKQEEVPVDQKPVHEESKVVIEETVQHTHISASSIEVQSVSESPVERKQEKEKDICEERLGDKSGTADDRETILKEEIHQLEEMPKEKQEEVPVDQKPLHEESKVVIEETIQHTHITASSIEVQSVSESPVEREQDKEKDICEERLGEKSISAEDRETILKEEVQNLEEIPVEKKEEVIIDRKPLQDESKIVIEESIQHTHISSTQDVHLLSEVPAEEREVQEEDVCKDMVGDVATDKGTILKDEACQLEEMPEDNQEEVLVDQEPPQEESKPVMEDSILHTHSLSIPVDVQSSSEAPAEEKEAQRGEDICEELMEDGATPTVDRDTIMKEEVHQLEEMPEIMQDEVPVGQEPLQEESKAVIEESVQQTHIVSTHVEMQLHEEKREEEEKDIFEKQLEDKGVTTTDRETILKDEIHLHEEIPADKPEEMPAEKPAEIQVDHASSHEESSICDEGIQHTTIYATHTDIQVVGEITVTEKEAHPGERDESSVQPHSLEVRTEEKVKDAVAVDYVFPQEDVQQRDEPQPDSDVDKLSEAASDQIEPEPKAEKVLDSADESFAIHTVETVHKECTEEDTLTTEYRETVVREEIQHIEKQLPDVKEDEKHTPHKEHVDVQESVQLPVITTHTEVNVPKEASSDQPQVTFSPPLLEHPQELSMEQQSHTSTKEEIVSDEQVEEPVLSHDHKEVILKEEISSSQERGAADTIDDIQPSLESQTHSEQQENLEKEAIFHEVVEQATVTSSHTEIHITPQTTVVEKHEIPEPHFDEAEGEPEHPGEPSQGTVHEERVDIQDQIPTDLQELPAGVPHDTLEESMQEVAITSAPTEICVSTEGLESERVMEQEPSTEPETSIPESLPCDVKKVDECIPTTEHKETILKDEEQLDKETLPVEKDIPESARGYEDAGLESVQQTVSTTTHTEVHISSTTTMVKEVTEEEAKSTPAEREDLSPIEEGVTSGEVVEYQEDMLAEPGEAASLRDQSAAYVERVIRTVQTREVRFVEETMVESSEPEDDVHIEDELDLTERDISMDDEHSDDSDMIPEIKLDLQSEEIVQDDEAVAERRARDHGYLIEPDPPTEESEIILGEDGISSEQLGVDDEDDYDMRTESISYMEEHVEEVPRDVQEGTESDSQLPSHSMLETTVATVPVVQGDSAKPPGRDKEEDYTVTSYKSIEQAMIVEKELYLESQPGQMDGETEQEIPSTDIQVDSGPEDGRGTPDILDITGEYATSYSHIEMMSHSYDVAEPGHQVIPSDKDAAVSFEQDQIETETGEPLHGTALAEIEQQYAVQTPASEREFQGQWVESQEGDAIVRTRQSHIEETYEDQTEDGTVVYHRKVVTETRVVTGEPFDERLPLSSQAPQDLVIHPQPPSPDSLVTPEIQELPDTPESLPESSTHDGSSVGPSDHQEFCYDSTSVAEVSSESRQLLYEDVQEPESHFQVQDTVLVDGPTESDYYDPNLIGNQQQEHGDFYDPESQQMGSEPEVLDSPQEVELPHGEDVDIMQYQDLSSQEQVSVSISYSEQAVTHTQFDEAMLTEALAQHAEEEDHYAQAPAHDQEVFQIEDSDRADSVVSPRPPEPVSDVESHLPPVDVNFLESEPSADQEETTVEEGEEKDEVDSPTKPFRGPMPAADPSEDEEDTESAQATGSTSQGSVDDSSTHYVVHEEYETKQEDGGIVKKSVHVTRTTFRREVSYPGEETQFGEAILQTRSSSEYLADHKETQPRQRQPMVDEQLEAPDIVGDVESKKPTYSPEELEDFAEVLNEFSTADLPEDEQQPQAPPSDQPLVQEDCSMTESVPPKVETNLKMLDRLTPEDEKELDDLLNRDFTQAYREEPEAERELAGGEPEEVSPSTPASPVTPHVDLFQDEAECDLQAAADQLEKEKEEKEEERPEGGEERKEEGDEQPREPKTPEISDFLDDQPTFPPSAPLGVVETQPNIEFPPDMDVPVDGDEDVEEEIEEYEETLDDGTIRKVIKRRIKKRTVQMIPVEIDPSQLPPGAMGEGDDDVRRITVHKKVTRKTFMRDGEEIDQQEECETNIEEDGIVKENSELREDLQQIVDGLLSDQSLEGAIGDGTTVVVEREETVEGEESEI
ncbi:uncharacterized protein [Diadema antillarum]|uniref:uncharacterized protein isoform X4 n=1 Tax=Diadema antillarum TaxID=105358 RepID=UPI003A86E27A